MGLFLFFFQIVNSAFGKFLKATEQMSPEQCAEYLKTDDSISSAHQESANEGQTETPHIDEEVDLHFIAFCAQRWGFV